MKLTHALFPLALLALASCSPPNASTNAGAQSAAGTTTAAADFSCDSPAAPLAIGATATGDIQAGQSYPNNARYFCINVPANTPSLTLEVSGMTADLDLYVGSGNIASVQGVNLEQGDTYQWKSNEFGTGAERVQITNPAAGIYYAEIVSYQGEASSFTIAAQ